MARWLGMATKPANRRVSMKLIYLFGLLLFTNGRSHGESGVVNKVVLELQIQGLSKEGCVIEITPGHPGCQFKKVRYKVDNPRVLLQPIEVTSLSADLDCSFAITIKEPGMPPQTFRRGLRLNKPQSAEQKPESKLTCFLATPSMAQQAKLDGLGKSDKTR